MSLSRASADLLQEVSREKKNRAVFEICIVPVRNLTPNVVQCASVSTAEMIK